MTPRSTKRRAMVATTAVMTLLLAACGAGGGGGDSDAKSINVLMVGNPQMVDIEKLTKDSFTKDTGIKVNYTILPENELRDKVTQDIATKAGQYDVATIGAYEVPIWHKNGWLQPLDSFADKDTKFDKADLLKPMDIDLPLEVKRGYHLHFRPRGNAGLTRPVVDAELGYCVAPMEQGLRLTTGAEFADRDAPPTPAQFDRLLPQARALFPLGEQVEAQPWMGSRPCFADSMPVIGRAPGQPSLWLAVGHAHWGLTLGPATGRLVAEMMTGATPFCDPTPFAAERFTA